MKDEQKSNAELVAELKHLRQELIKAKAQEFKGKAAEEELLVTEERYEALLANIPVGVFRSTADKSGRLLSANPALAKMLGYESAADMVHVKVKDFYTRAEDRMEFMKAVGNAGAVADYEVKMKRRDGSTFWGALSARAVRGRESEIAYFDGILEDITERKKAEGELALQRRRAEKAVRELQALIDNADILLWSVYEDDDGQLRYEKVNEAFAAVEGNTAAFYEGKRIEDIASAAQLKAIWSRYEWVKLGRTYSYEKEYGRDDARRCFNIKLIPLTEADGRVRRFIGSAVDVTASKRTAAELLRNVRALEAVNRFAADMTAADNVEDFLAAAASLLADNAGVIAGAIYLMDRDANLLKLARSFGPKPDAYEARAELPLSDKTIRTLLAARAPVFLESWPKGIKPGDFIPPASSEEGYVIAAPIRAEEATEGILTFTLKAADDHTVSFVGLMATELCSGISRKRNEEELADYRRRLEELVEERTRALQKTNENLQKEIEERKQVEAAIRYFSGFTENIIESTEVGIYALDREGRIQIWNRGMERQFNVDSDGVVGKKVFEVFPALREEVLGGAVKRALAAGETFSDPHLAHRTLNRGERILATRVNPMTGADGGIEGVVVITEDVSERLQAQEALRRSEQRYHAATEAALAGIVINDAQERITFVNPAFAEMVGYDAAELLDMSISDITDEPEYKRYREEARLRMEGAYSLYESRLVRKDGKEVSVIVSAAPLAAADGSYEGNLGIITDITDRKEAEKALRLTEQRLRQFAETVPDILYRLNVTTGCYEYLSPALERVLGYDAEEAIADPGGFAEKTLVPEDREAASRAVEEFLAAGAAEGRLVLERRLRRADGEIIWVRDAMRFEGREDGAYVASGVISDITEQKKADKALRESEERYRSLVEAMHGGMAIVDDKENVVFVNQAYCDMLGYGRDELVGRNLRELVAAAELPKLLETTADKLRANTTTKYETVMQRKDGALRDVLVSSAPLLDANGEYYLTIGVALDITDEKKMAHELQVRTRELEETRRRADDLLSNILPETVKAELEEAGTSQPRLVPNATIVFVDFANFAEIAARINHKALLTKLSAYFHTFDLIVRDRGLEKLKTMGGVYMFAGGLFTEDDQLESCVGAALEVLKFVGWRDWRVRVGVNVGPCIAGLVRGWRMVFDVWGPTVNVASSLKEISEPGRMCVSEAVANRLAGKYEFEKCGELEIPGGRLADFFYLSLPEKTKGATD